MQGCFADAAESSLPLGQIGTTDAVVLVEIGIQKRRYPDRVQPNIVKFDCRRRLEYRMSQDDCERLSVEARVQYRAGVLNNRPIDEGSRGGRSGVLLSHPNRCSFA